MNLRRSNAFTLVELLLVIVMIAVLAGGAVVNLHGRGQSHALMFGAKDLAATLEYGLGWSAGQGRQCRLSFDQSWRRYRLEELAFDGASDYQALAGKSGQWHDLPTGVAVRGIEGVSGPIDPMPQTLSLSSDASGFSGHVELASSDGKLAWAIVHPVTRLVTYAESK